MQNLEMIQQLIGDVCEEDLEFVDSYTSDGFGIFIPGVGFRGFAVKPDQTHPSYFFTIFQEENQSTFKTSLRPEANQYIAGILPPGKKEEQIPGGTLVRYIAIFISENLLKNIVDLKMLNTSDSRETFLISKDMLYLINRFIDETKDQKKEEVLDALSHLMASDLVRAYTTGDSTPTITAGNEVQASVDYIERYYNEPLKIGDLAHRVGLSISDFAEKFKSETGHAPKNYIIQTRLEKARSLIRSNEKTLTEIALSCGFNSVTHMDSSHKKYYGMTPSAYKRSHASFR